MSVYLVNWLMVYCKAAALILIPTANLVNEQEDNMTLSESLFLLVVFDNIS